jgi:hypothetical protein
MVSLFLNTEKGYFNIKPDAPFYESIGFLPIPVSKMGLYDSEYRATPVNN